MPVSVDIPLHNIRQEVYSGGFTVQHRFKLDDEYYSELTEKEIEEDRMQNASRWANGLSMLSLLDTIHAPPVKK